MRQENAILVVSFGTSHLDTLEKTIAAIERDIADAYPQWAVRRAFTSGRIIRILCKRDNFCVDTTTQALQKLADDGFSRVVIQPTHVMNGEEYDKIILECQRFRKCLDMYMGAPLLSAAEDYQSLAHALGEAYPAQRGYATCLMGHGTTHFADSAYAALDYHFKNIGREDIFVGTVEGFPDLAAVRRGVRAFAPRGVRLVPLMVVAGDHARNDMAGEHADSWSSVFRADGFDVECILRGLGEYSRVREIYLGHVKTALQTV